MIAARVNPNISYASIVSRNYNKIYSFQSPRKQYFSFPYEIMKYIIKNPKSPEGLIKFNQTCKYFYLKQKILVVAGKFELGSISAQYQFDNVYDHKNMGFLKNVKTPNLWLHGEIAIDKEYFIDFKKVYRSTIKCLVIFEAEITLKELELLVAKTTVETFILSRFGKIIDSTNQKNVPVNVILKLLPNVLDFRHFSEDEKYLKETLEKMVAIKFESKLETFVLYLNEVSADFDANLLFQFVLKNAGQLCKINFIPVGQNKEATLLKLKAAEAKIKSTEKWKEQKLDFSFEITD